jgi:hypothetical protein
MYQGLEGIHVTAFPGGNQQGVVIGYDALFYSQHFGQLYRRFGSIIPLSPY